MEERHEQTAPATNANINPELLPQGARVHAWPPAQPPAITPRMNGADRPYYPPTNGQQEYRLPGQQILPSAVSLPPIQQYKPATEMPYAPMNGETHAQVQFGYMPPNGQVPYNREYARYTPPPIHPMPAYAPHLNGMRLDPRQMSGGRHKKEIKRRTKTGCMTCRKRRIKCDERHPECRNCEKSKRDCLGYDPVFKQQSGPAQIQPAPLQKSETDMAVPMYAPGPYNVDDMYGAARPPPPPASASAPPVPYQHTYGPPPGMESQQGLPPGQHYHPQFDQNQRSESKV